ncbi:hypothetical protein M569_17304, partial [Genlisea aurea]
AMEDIGLFSQGLRWWFQSKDCCSVVRASMGCIRDKVGVLMDRHWPMVCYGCAKSVKGILLLLVYWRNCLVSGFQSFIRLGPAALLVIMWSCFISLTSMSCLFYLLFSMGAAGVAVHNLGYTPGLFIVGLFAILVLWMYANFWITGVLLLVGGYLFSLNHARLAVFMASLYAIYCVKIRVGWIGVFLAVNLAFLSHDILNYLIKRCDKFGETAHFDDPKESSDSSKKDGFSSESDFSVPPELGGEEKPEKFYSCKSTCKPSAATSSFVESPEESDAKNVTRQQQDADSSVEMERILRSGDHYEALGFSRHKKIDTLLLKKEYRKK